MDFQFWTADHEGNRQVWEWLHDNPSLNSIGFYACFVNWCHQQVSRVRIPGTKFQSEADKARSQNVWDVLRERPLDMRAFIGLMDDYAKRQYADGDKLGYIRAPEKADSETLAMGHRRLKQIVWTQAERMAFAMADGSDWGLKGNVRRRVEWARQGKLNAISAAAEERQSALGQYEGMENAVSGIGKNIGVDDASAVAGEEESNTMLPWNADLADRTRA